MSDLPKFDLPLLRKAVEWAEAEAKLPETDSQWYQGTWCSPGSAVERTCGTAYCIAGFVVSTQYTFDQMWEGDVEISSTAMEMLGLNYEEGVGGSLGTAGLFAAYNDIDDIREIARRIAANHGEEL